MEFTFNEDQLLFQSAVRDFLDSECTPEVVRALFPHTRQPGPRERCEARVSLHGPGAGAAPVEVRCAGVFARRTSQAAWHVGFEFIDPPPPALLWIEGHIDSALRGAGG